MLLKYGSAGSAVQELQGLLNKLPSKLPPLAVDGKFGSKTLARVKEFQGANALTVDGVVGPKTMAMLLELLKNLGGLVTPPTPSDVSVRPITKQILGMEPTNNLVQQIFPTIGVVNVATFRAGDKNNAPNFSISATRTGRLGIFAAKKGDSERAVILVLPASAFADRILLGVSHGFGQNAAHYGALGWGDPLSPPLILEVLLKHVVNRWGAQVLAGKKAMGLLHIVRAAGVELGPFAHDGVFVKEVLTQLVALTNNAFSFGTVEAFTFSSGIGDFNPFLAAISGQVNVGAVYNIDPAKATPCGHPAGAVVKQFLSGQTGAPKVGFEFMPLKRWKNEVAYPTHAVIGTFNYLHNLCMSRYALHLGIQTS
ncbi:MAG: peptidoglycan-binding protein [Gemmatimonadota bacterium]|nr:peptidoglycan-binding protein [Gemmatimonadota bacterium]